MRPRHASAMVGFLIDEARSVVVDARPESLAIDPRTTAVIVVDMQNDFGARGGMFARAGIPIADIETVVDPIAHVLRAARRIGMKVIYLTMQFEPDLSDAGPPDSPNFLKHKLLGVGDIVPAPDGRSTPERGGRRSFPSSRRKKATLSSRSTATAASSRQSWTRSCASMASNRSSSPVARRAFASTPPCETRSTATIAACCSATAPASRSGATSHAATTRQVCS
jgi:isochorismatase family protein